MNKALGPPPTITLQLDGLRYQLQGLHGGKKIVLSVSGGTAERPRRLVDRLDLASFRARKTFSEVIAETFAITSDVAMGHLAVVLDEAERASVGERTTESVTLTPERRTAAERLLAQPDLLNLAADTLEGLGYVGEEENKRLSFLVAVSRLLRQPLSAILRAESGSGKSQLLERIAEITPPESVEFLSRLTPAALYHLEPGALRNKVIIVDEHAGMADGDYAVRTLQSRGVLRLAAPMGGKTEYIEVRGPIALMSSTTRSVLNAEDLSRCLELRLDDSPEQTRRVQEAQRLAWTGEKTRDVDVQLWHDVQRLLESVEVIVPFATRLSYPTRTTRDRRDNVKLLCLIAAHALLVQRQRQRDQQGRLVATLDDYRVVHAILAPLVENELDGLSPRASKTYRALSKCQGGSFSRHEASTLMSSSYNTTKRALEELIEHELLRVADHGMPRRYELVTTLLASAGFTLTDPNKLASDFANTLPMTGPLPDLRVT